MTGPSLKLRLATTILTGAFAALALSACNKAAQPAGVAPADALPLTDASGPLTPAPAASALPPAPPIRVAHLRDPRQNYAYLDRAANMGHAFAGAPPDYTYDYQGAQPWVWRSSDDARQVVEPLADGVRSYYYQPGASLPFLIRDDGYSYGYDSGQLVIVYDSYGRPLPPTEIELRIDLAARYLQRAREIYLASLNARREAVVRANWLARRDPYALDQERWEHQQAEDADWRAYHERYAAAEEARWANERRTREAEVARLPLVAAYQPPLLSGHRPGTGLNLQQPPPSPAPNQQLSRMQTLQAERQDRDSAAARAELTARRQALARDAAQSLAQQQAAQTARQQALLAEQARLHVQAQALHAQQQAQAVEQARQRLAAEQAAIQLRAQAQDQAQAQARARAEAQAQALHAQQQARAVEQARQRLAAAQAAIEARAQAEARARAETQARAATANGNAPSANRPH